MRTLFRWQLSMALLVVWLILSGKWLDGGSTKNCLGLGSVNFWSSPRIPRLIRALALTVDGTVLLLEHYTTSLPLQPTTNPDIFSRYNADITFHQ